MAFVTNYTLSRLARYLDLKEEINQEIFVKHIFSDDRIYSFFNKLELKYLFNYKKLLANSLEELGHYVKVPESRDTETYVYEKEAKLNYHLFKECEFLKRDFRGFVIPKEVKENKLISEYRKWFVNNNFQEKFDSGEIKKDLLIYKYNTEFSNDFSLPKLNPNYSLVKDIPNSGNIHLEQSFDFELFLAKIEDCLQYKRDLLNTKEKRILGKWEGLKNKSNIEIIEKIDGIFGSGFCTRFNVENLRKFWNQYSKIKNGIILKGLVDYFKWTYRNESKDLDRYTLENFNLKCCSNCEKKESSQERKSNTKDKDLPF